MIVSVHGSHLDADRNIIDLRLLPALPHTTEYPTSFPVVPKFSPWTSSSIHPQHHKPSWRKSLQSTTWWSLGQVRTPRHSYCYCSPRSELTLIFRSNRMCPVRVRLDLDASCLVLLTLQSVFSVSRARRCCTSTAMITMAGMQSSSSGRPT
jgi:hypothetical protein